MKEKRILAMFITSVVTLVASLAVTFGIMTTLADPVLATGIQRYAFAFNAVNKSEIAVDGQTLKLKENIVFQPSSSIVWENTEVEGQMVNNVVWFNSPTYDGDIMFYDESISPKVKVIPIRVTNNYTGGNPITTNINVAFDKTTLLGKYTVVKIYDFETGVFTTTSSLTLPIKANESKDFAIVVYVDDSNNTGRDSIDFTKAFETINVEITNKSVM